MGGSKITASIPTIDVNYVPTLSTREIDLKDAAASGQALTADIPATNLYDVASENQWLNNNNLSFNHSRRISLRALCRLRGRLLSVRHKRVKRTDRSILLLPALCRFYGSG